MRAVHAGNLPRALALIDAGHATQHEQRGALQAASDALRTLAEQPPDNASAPADGMRIGELAVRLGMRTSALRVWEGAGLLRLARDRHTGYRRYGPADIRDAEIIRLLRQSHYRFPQIRTILDDLRRAGDTDALTAAIERRRAELDRRATAMLEGASLLHHFIERFLADP